jgi:hypothetical protein
VKLKTTLVAVCVTLMASSSIAEGLGISSKIYADRFNKWAAEFKTPMRLRSDGAKVTKGDKVTTVKLTVDKQTSMILSYRADPSSLSGVTLFRQLGGDTNQNIEAMTSMIMTSMSAFEDPKASKVPDLTVKVCSDAMKKPATSYDQKVQNVTLSCTLIDGVVVLALY